MANRPIKDNTYRGVVIDTAPGANGYYSEAVNAVNKRVGQMVMSLAGIWAGTVKLQYREDGNPGWTTYEDFTDNTRQIIEDYTNCEWRVGMASGGYTSGTLRARIEYHDRSVSQ